MRSAGHPEAMRKKPRRSPDQVKVFAAAEDYEDLLDEDDAIQGESELNGLSALNANTQHKRVQRRTPHNNGGGQRKLASLKQKKGKRM